MEVTGDKRKFKCPAGLADDKDCKGCDYADEILICKYGLEQSKRILRNYHQEAFREMKKSIENNGGLV